MPEADGMPTDQELSEAFDKGKETPKEEEPAEVVSEEEPQPEAPTEEVEEPTPEEPDEATKSRLGRRLKKMEEEFYGLRSGFDGIASKLDVLLSKEFKGTGGAQEPEEEEELDEIVDGMTRKELQKTFEKWQTNYEQKKAKEASSRQNAYAASYMRTLNLVGQNNEMPEEEYESVYELCTGDGQPFNKVQTGNPEVDARLNFAEARAHFLTSGSASPNNSPKVPLLGRRSRVPLEPKVTPKVPSKPSPPIKLPPDAEALLRDAKNRGIEMSEEEVRQAISGPAPLTMGGKTGF